MASLQILRIKCFDQADWTGTDEIKVVVWNRGAGEWITCGDMSEDEDGRNMVALSREITFRHGVRVQVKKHDTARWTTLGDTLAVYEDAADGSEKKLKFTDHDSYHYEVWYRVIPGEAPAAQAAREEQEQQQQEARQETEERAADRTTHTRRRPRSRSQRVGSSTVSCTQAELIVLVTTPDGAPIEDAQVSLDWGPWQETEADGKYNFGMVTPGEHHVRAHKYHHSPNSARAVREVQCPTTVVELHLSPLHSVTVRPSSSYRQFINMSQGDNESHFGPQIDITATVEPRAANVMVYFTVTPDATGTPVATAPGPAPSTRAGLSAALQASISHLQPSIDPPSAKTNAYGVARTKLTLSQYGGDQCRVGASLTAGNDPEATAWSGLFTTWRKVQYEFDAMRIPGDPNRYFGDVVNLAHFHGPTGNFGPMNIAIQKIGDTDHPDHQRIINGDAAAEMAADVRQRRPRAYFQFLLVDILQRRDQTTGVTDSTDITATTADEKYQLTVPRNVIPGDWFIHARYKLKNPPGAPWVDLTIDDFELFLDVPYKTDSLFLNLRGRGLDPSTSPIVVEVRFKCVVGLSGQALRNGTTVVAVRFRETAFPGHVADSILRTMIHESGHSMGLSSRTLPNGAANPQWDSNLAHQNGMHCIFGGSSCSMFWAAANVVKILCPTCRLLNRANDLTSLPDFSQ